MTHGNVRSAFFSLGRMVRDAILEASCSRYPDGAGETLCVYVMTEAKACTACFVNDQDCKHWELLPTHLDGPTHDTIHFRYGHRSDTSETVYKPDLSSRDLDPSPPSNDGVDSNRKK
jgi:hypothetical protein